MTSKTIFLLMLAVMLFACQYKKNQQTKWRQENILGYTLKLPQGYTIHYTADSLSVEITNKEIKIYFVPGYFNVDEIENAKSFRSRSQLGSVKKIVFDSVQNNLTSAYIALWDTSKVTHLFGDSKYKGCHLSVNRLTDIQTDTVMVIFNSLMTGIVAKDKRKAY